MSNQHLSRLNEWFNNHNLLSELTPIVIFILIWQIAGSIGLLSKTILPTPFEVILAGITSVKEGFFWGDLWASVCRIIPGFLLGSLFGIIVGIASGRLKILSKTLGPILNMWRALPTVALVPFFIQLFGINESSKIIIIATGVFFPVWINSHEGASQLKRDYIDLAINLELPKGTFYTKLVVPFTLPFAVAGIRIGIAIAYIMLFVSEWVGANMGIGYRISIAHIVGRMDLMLFGLIELGILAYLTDLGFKKIVRSVFLWVEYTNE